MLEKLLAVRGPRGSGYARLDIGISGHPPRHPWGPRNAGATRVIRSSLRPWAKTTRNELPASTRDGCSPSRENGLPWHHANPRPDPRTEDHPGEAAHRPARRLVSGSRGRAAPRRPAARVESSESAPRSVLARPHGALRRGARRRSFARSDVDPARIH